MARRLSPAALGRWSARRPWLAIGCWLGFVVLAVALLAATGSKSLTAGATGESKRAEQMILQHQTRPDQYERAYLHSDSLRVGTAAFRAATAKVRARMTEDVGPATVSYSQDGHSVLVSARLRRPFRTGELRTAVAAAGTSSISATLDDNSRDGNSDL